MNPGPGPGGLVKSAKTDTSPPEGAEAAALDAADLVIPDDLGPLLEGYFAFPSAELVAAAASMWPDAPEGWAHRWHARATADPRNDRVTVDGWAEYRDAAEGGFPFLEIGPGIIRFGRESARSIDAADARARRERAEAVDSELRNTYGPIWDVDGPSSSDRVIGPWSAKSRARLRAKILRLDLAPVVTGESLPVLVTLTYPAVWEAYAPTAASAAAALAHFRRAWASKWKEPLRGIWKREFQRRGAPHWHIWTVPPVAPSRGEEFRAWVSAAWHRAVFNGFELCDNCETRRPASSSVRCAHCRDRELHVLAGTGVDVDLGLQARDPRRLATYFLKESLGGEGKSYQNRPPRAWGASSIGRYWGVVGLSEVVERVPVHPRDQWAIWRSVRRIRDRYRPVELVRTTWVDTHCEIAIDERLNPETGELERVIVPVRLHGEYRSRRPVNRRSRTRQRAGWVSVNDGAAVGATLGRYASMLAIANGDNRGHAKRPAESLPSPTGRCCATCSSSADAAAEQLEGFGW